MIVNRYLGAVYKLGNAKYPPLSLRSVRSGLWGVGVKHKGGSQQLEGQK